MKFILFMLLGLVLSGESLPQVLKNKKYHNSNEIQLIEQKEDVTENLDLEEILKTINKTQPVTDQNDDKLSDEIIDSLIGCGIFSVTTAGLVYLGPAAVGFRSLGVAKNSIMAAIQSFYGNIAKHSWFAAVQSWTYRSGGAALLQTSAATGALTGSSCLVIFSEFWEALPEEYFGDEAMEIYKQFAIEKANDIKDFTTDIAEEISETWNEDVVPELEEFYENTKHHTVRISRKVGTETKSFYDKTIDKTVEISEKVAKGTKKVYKKAMKSNFMNHTKSVGQDIGMGTKKLWSKVAGGTSSAGKKGYDYGVIAVTAVGGYFGNIFG